jgi:hypothetical protein
MEIGKCQAYIVDNCLKSQKKKELMLCLLVICRSSLLPDVGHPVYGSPVKVLPTEDFLSVRILVRLSTFTLEKTEIRTKTLQYVTSFRSWHYKRKWFLSHKRSQLMTHV